MEEETMDISQLSKYAGLSEETITRFIHTDQIPFLETPKGYRFEKSTIDLWLHFLDSDYMH